MATITTIPEANASYLSLVKDKGDGEFAVLATFNNDNCNMSDNRFRQAIDRFIMEVDGDVMLLERQDTPDTIMAEEY